MEVESEDDALGSLAPTVHFLARKISRIYGTEYDDAVQDGWLGAMEAVRSWDCDREVPLRSFAFHRIRGSIIDGYRSRTPLSRSADRPQLCSLDAMYEGEGMDVPCYDDTTALENEELVRWLLSHLNTRQRRIVIWYFWDGWTLLRISRELGLTEGRVSQILTKVKAQCRARCLAAAS
jgi:RNA polymerase sigma factor (sigma-70 family)